MSTPRDPRSDRDADTRAWSAQGDETQWVDNGESRRAGGGESRRVGDDETQRVGGDETQRVGGDETRRVGDADRTTGYGQAYGSDPTVAYGNGGAPSYGADPTQAYGGAPTYGSDPTAAYGATGASAQQQAPPNHPPTAQYPPTAAWSTHTDTYGRNAYGQHTSTYQENTAGYGQAPGPGSYSPPPTGDQRSQPAPSGGRGGRTGRYVLIALAVLVLLFLLGLLAWGLQSTSDSNDNAQQTSAVPAPTSAPTTTAPPTTSPNAQLPLPSIELPQIPGLDSLPDLGEAIGGSGVTIGSIQSLGETSIVVDGLTGPVTVTITPQTEIVGINAAAIGDLSVGEQVVIEGSPVQDGQTTATRIVSTSIPGSGN